MVTKNMETICQWYMLKKPIWDSRKIASGSAYHCAAMADDRKPTTVTMIWIMENKLLVSSSRDVTLSQRRFLPFSLLSPFARTVMIAISAAAKKAFIKIKNPSKINSDIIESAVPMNSTLANPYVLSRMRRAPPAGRLGILSRNNT